MCQCVFIYHGHGSSLKHQWDTFLSVLSLDRFHHIRRQFYLCYSECSQRMNLTTLKDTSGYFFFNFYFNKAKFYQCNFSSVQSPSGVWLFVTPWIAACQASLSPTLRACSNSGPSCWWCHPTISFSINHSYCPQSFPAPGSFLMSQCFTL